MNYKPLLNYFTDFELIQGWIVFAFIVFMVLCSCAIMFYMNNISEIYAEIKKQKLKDEERSYDFKSRSVYPSRERESES